MTEAPRRKYKVAIIIEADEPKGIVSALSFLEFYYASKGPGRNMTHGGPDYGINCVDNEDPNQTHERFFEQVEAWLAERREVEGPPHE